MCGVYVVCVIVVWKYSGICACECSVRDACVCVMWAHPVVTRAPFGLETVFAETTLILCIMLVLCRNNANKVKILCV